MCVIDFFPIIEFALKQKHQTSQTGHENCAGTSNPNPQNSPHPQKKREKRKTNSQAKQMHENVT